MISIRIPDYVSLALTRRKNAGILLIHNDGIINKFIREKHIKLDEEDYNLGTQVINNPEESFNRVLEAIKNR